MKLDKFQEHAFFITVRIVSVRNSDAGASIGTGFLFRAFLDEEKKDGVTLLISNKHVFDNPKNSVEFNFHVKDANDSAPLLTKTVTLSSDNFKNNYLPHPDDKIDLACVNVSKITTPEFNIFFKCIDESFILECSDLEIMPGDEAWFVGYPQGRFDEVHNLPILRRGYIASPPSIDFNGNKEFLVDANVFPGSSGSPVFTSFKGRFRLIGVISQVMIKDSRIQKVNSVISEFGVKQEIGLGIVIKSECIIDLISYATKEIARLLKYP